MGKFTGVGTTFYADEPALPCAANATDFSISPTGYMNVYVAGTESADLWLTKDGVGASVVASGLLGHRWGQLNVMETGHIYSWSLVSASGRTLASRQVDLRTAVAAALAAATVAPATVSTATVAPATTSTPAPAAATGWPWWVWAGLAAGALCLFGGKR